MEIKVAKNKGEHLKVTVNGIDAAMANIIRRVSHGDIPVMAVDYVDITANNSGLVDEILAHRIGLIPLKWPVKTYSLPDECKCSGRGCSNCEVKFRLSKEGPCVVYSEDMVSNDKDVQPLHPKIPIVELLENQKISFVAVAKLGFGKNHIKHQAATVGYSKGSSGYTFNIESVCGLTAEEVFIRALEIISQRADEFRKAVKKEV